MLVGSTLSSGKEDVDEEVGEEEDYFSDSEIEVEKCDPVADCKCFVSSEALGCHIFETLQEGTRFLAIRSGRKGVKFGPNGLELTIQKRLENPALASSAYIMYGKVEAEIKGSYGSGIISSFYLQSDVLDEIDVAEVFGSDPYQYQTNFFIKGNVSKHERGKYHQVQKSPLSQYHKYGCEWTPEKVTWFVNDEKVREIGCKNKFGIPNTPMAVKFSLWAGEDTHDEGTIAWSGGNTNYREAPFTMAVKNLKILDYSTGQAYSYGWLPDGSWADVTSAGGSIYHQDQREKWAPKRPSATSKKPMPTSETSPKLPPPPSLPFVKEEVVVGFKEEEKQTIDLHCPTLVDPLITEAMNLTINPANPTLHHDQQHPFDLQTPTITTVANEKLVPKEPLNRDPTVAASRLVPRFRTTVTEPLYEWPARGSETAITDTEDGDGNGDGDPSDTHTTTNQPYFETLYTSHYYTSTERHFATTTTRRGVRARPSSGRTKNGFVQFPEDEEYDDSDYYYDDADEEEDDDDIDDHLDRVNNGTGRDYGGRKGVGNVKEIRRGSQRSTRKGSTSSWRKQKSGVPKLISLSLLSVLLCESVIIITSF
ncbi:uncharacterized protein LODBEIA_P54280 [Lodderomyces beijingensis]|uniref:GH16 domain-containing protein n=1 Tax=Lodderomyces beijingensis TaxID=1775926 RepID=A0ABP0ZST6_9ASCO